MNEAYITRHRDLINLNSLGAKIIVVGAGAIGSFTVLSLAKMGFHNITVYDFDTVENENIGAQFYSVDSIGKPKVVALKEMVKNFTGIEINAVERKVTDKDPIEQADFVIAALDSMSARKLVFDRFIGKYLIDPRMSAEYATLHVVKLSSRDSTDNYSKTLYSDEEAVHERCTAKTTIYTVLLIAGQVVKAVKDIIMDKPYIEVMDWSIRDNSMVAFSSDGKKL